tara:strand:- start:142 stop:1233 length:1092 start_codon:yes stop_codon:yes gene_type:complete
MSGRSGYGRSKIVGKLIHLPANMMIAGLAPKVGKSGASIRLYWQRVAECCVGCKDDPIRITKRGIAPGDVVTGNWSNTSGGGTIINASSEVVIDLGQNGRLTNVQYVVVFDKEISSAFAVDPPAGATLELRTPLAVNWSTGVPANQSIYQKSIPVGDFKILNFGTTGTPNNNTIGTANSGWQIAIDGSTNTANGPGLVPNTDLSSGLPCASINYNQGSGGLSVGLSSLVGNMSANDGSMVYLVTNTTHFGGYAIVFNITRLAIASIADSTVVANWDSFNANNGGLRDKWRQDVANITWYNGNTPPDRNNIGLSFNPNTKTSLTANVRTCPPFKGLVAPFKISVGDIVNPTNLPKLTLIDNVNW